MSELVDKVKEQKRRKMKLRRTHDLLSQEVLLQDLASVKKPVKKVKRKKNHVFLPQIDDLFDSGIQTNHLKENNMSTASSSTNEIDFKKPVFDKKGTKTSTKIKCIGQSWLVESYTDVSSSADNTKENCFETGSCKKSITKKKKNSGSVQKNKPKINVLEDVQLKPCFVMLQKLKYDVNDKVDDESFKFLPSNSSSPFLRRHLSDSKVLQGQSSLTKDMFEELPNWSKSDYWDVEDVVGKPKAEDGSKSVSNIGNSTFELNRPSLNSTIGLSTSKKSLKSNSTFEIEKPLNVSQRKKSIRSQSITATIKPTDTDKQDSINVVDKSKLEDGSKSVSNINNSTYELNRSLMNGTLNLSASRKSLKNNSTFEIDKPLDVSRKLPQRSRSSEKQKTLENVNKTAADDGSKSISNGDDSKTKLTTSEKRKRFCRISKTVNGLKTSLHENNYENTQSSFLDGNLLTDSEKRGLVYGRRSTFTVNDNPNNCEAFQLARPERKKWAILDENERSSSRRSLRESLANIFNSPVPNKRQTIGETSAKLQRRKWSIFNQSPVKLPTSFLNRESGFISQTLDETSRTPGRESDVFVFGEKSSEAPKTPEKFSNASFSILKKQDSPVSSEPSQPGDVTRRRSTLTLDDTVTDIDVLKSACDLYGSPKELEQCEEPICLPSSKGTTKKMRRVTFKDRSVIVIDDSESSFDQGTPIIEEIVINDSENDSFTVTSTTSPKNRSPCEPRRRISSDSSLYKKSIGLNHKIRLASDDLAIKNKNLPSASKSKLKKMPNFAKIHQKMFDKMPDLREYSEKKKERARLLLSGKKVPQQAEKIVPVTKKQLFSSAPASTKSNLVSSTPNVNKKMVGYTRFGFQVDQRKVAAKQEQIKAVANKIRPDNVLPRQRFKEELKGVRSNKRFELLMKMRQN